MHLAYDLEVVGTTRYQGITWIGDCLRTGKPSGYISKTSKVTSAYRPSGVGLEYRLSSWG